MFEELRIRWLTGFFIALGAFIATAIGLMSSGDMAVALGIGTLFLMTVFFLWSVTVRRIKTGSFRDRGNLGETYLESLVGRNNDCFSNTPGTVNYDHRYPDHWFIPLREEVVRGGRERRWGPPGYEITKEPTDTTYVSQHSLTMWILGIESAGIFPFGRWLGKKSEELKMVPAEEVTRKLKERNGGFTDAELLEYPDDHEEWDLNWVDFHETHCLLSREVFRYDHYLNFTTTVVIRKVETGGPKDVDEMMLIDVVLELRVRVLSSFALISKNISPKTVLVAKVDAVVRDFVASQTIDQILKGKNDDPESVFHKAINANANGHWDKDGTNYYPSRNGLMEAGLFITVAYFRMWSPADERAEVMMNAAQDVFISKKKIETKTNEGKAAAAEKVEYYKAVGPALQKYKKEVNVYPVDANLKVVADAIGGLKDLKGTFVAGNLGDGMFNLVKDIDKRNSEDAGGHAEHDSHEKHEDHGAHGHEDKDHGGHDEKHEDKKDHDGHDEKNDEDHHSEHH